VTYSEVSAHLAKRHEDDGLLLREIVEATHATAAFGAPEVRLIVDEPCELGRRHDLGPTAVVVGDDVSYGVLRMLEVMVEHCCDIRPFHTRLEAEQWLDLTAARRSKPG